MKENEGYYEVHDVTDRDEVRHIYKSAAIDICSAGADKSKWQIFLAVEAEAAYIALEFPTRGGRMWKITSARMNAEKLARTIQQMKIRILRDYKITDADFEKFPAQQTVKKLFSKWTRGELKDEPK